MLTSTMRYFRKHKKQLQLDLSLVAYCQLFVCCTFLSLFVSFQIKCWAMSSFTSFIFVSVFILQGCIIIQCIFRTSKHVHYEDQKYALS